MFFLTYISVSAGISIIISQSTIFEGLRARIGRMSPFFHAGINCPLCVGFWVGIFLSVIGVSPTHAYIYPHVIEVIPQIYVYYFLFFLNGVISSIFSWTWFNFVDFLQKKHLYDYIENQMEETEEILTD